MALVLGLLAAAPSHGGRQGFLVGVDDDQITWAARPSRFVGAAQTLGLGGMRVTLRWRPGHRNLEAGDHTVLRRAVAADGYGLRVVLSVYGRADDAPRTARAREDYCRFVRNVLLRYTEIGDVVIWNEVNSPAFWRPQEGAPAAYEALLARCWDLVHAADPTVNVIVSTAGAHDPVSFLHGVAHAYAASGRTRPIFDTFGLNPYPLYPGEPPAAQHLDYVGEGDYDRVVTALDAAFAATPVGSPPVWYLEDGFQTRVARHRLRLYAGRESERRTLSPAAQALQVATALRLAYCQPRVTAFFNFLLVDEPTLPGWQSGLMWADWQRKPAFGAYRQAIDEVRSGTVDCNVRIS